MGKFKEYFIGVMSEECEELVDEIIDLIDDESEDFLFTVRDVILKEIEKMKEIG